MAKAKLVATKNKKARVVHAPAKRFFVKRMKKADFKGGGLRDFFRYRDLGMMRVSGGKVEAHVTRPARPSDHGGTGRHFHSLDFQMVYCLRGWLTFWFKGKGNVTLSKGDCVYMPPGIHHDLYDWSEDMEYLEITLPAKYETVAVS
jgi:mannose-6-phosphate isomerase-like protein (cupin superfamily)